MKTIVFLFFFLSVNIHGKEKIKVIKLSDLLDIFNQDSEQVQVINFWATWCKPCIQELPEFEKANIEIDNIKVLLISLDDIETLDDKVIPFIEKFGLTSEMKLLDETDYNSIIEKIHPDWSGAIPATLIIGKDGKKHLFEKEFKEGELHSLIHNFIK